VAKKKKKRARSKPAAQADADVIVLAMSEQAAPTPPEVKLLQKELRALKRKQLEGHGVEALIRTVVAEHYETPIDLVLPRAPKKVGTGTEQVAVAHLSDTQLGKETLTYDSAVGAERCMEYARKVVEITNVRRNGAKIESLRLYLGGDMVEGETGNYPSQPYDIDSSVIRQAMRNGPDIFEGMIYYFLEHFKKIHVVGVPGNHGRGASRFATKHAETNWDRVCYWVLHDRIMGSEVREKAGLLSKRDKEMKKRITWDIPEGDQFWAVDRVWGWGNLIVHGDQIRGWAGIPFYGVQKKSSGWADTMPRDWDNLLFGHFHTYAAGTINYRKWYCNGTTESSNTYALEQLAAAGVPSQRLLFMTKKNGVISDHQIFLGDLHQPVMERKLSQAAAELSEDQFMQIANVIFARQKRDEETTK
jgi:hypothetical protein